MTNEQDFRSFNYNVLGQKSKVIGDIVLTGDSVITSEIIGNVVIQNQGQLVLERGSFIKGKVQCRDIEIFGQIEGDIESSGLVPIRSGAVVVGAIKSQRLVIYPGAVVEIKADSEED